MLKQPLLLQGSVQTLNIFPSYTYQFPNRIPNFNFGAKTTPSYHGGGGGGGFAHGDFLPPRVSLDERGGGGRGVLYGGARRSIKKTEKVTATA